MSIDDDILKGTSNVAEESADTMEQEQHCITVSQTLRLHNESVNVRGVIVGISEPIKMISARTFICNTCDIKLETETHDRPRFVDSPKNLKCPTCNSSVANRYDYVNVVKVKLQDDGSDVQLEQLTCLLFGADTLNIHSGEMVEVTGYVEVQKRKDVLQAILYAQSVKYDRKQEPEVTPRDIESFKRFAKMPNLIDRLVSMFAPEVIGHAAEKHGILRSLVGSPEGKMRGRIHTLLIGPPGVAKSMLTRKAVKVGESNSRYVTAQNASGKGITAIIDKENDATVLRLGAVPQARGAVCCINEIGRMDYEDQGFLLDVMEEGSFTVDKYAIHHEIRSPTTIIATANPRGIKWDDPFRISNEEIPVLGTLRDRFDQVYAVSEFMSDEECREYAAKKAEMDQRNIQYNNNFLKSYIKYAKSINPTILPEAQSMLTEFWLDLKKRELATNRTLDSLFRIAKSQARLHLSDVVNEEIVTEIMEDYMQRMLQYGQIIKIIESSRDVTYREILSIIEATRSPIELTEAARMACQKNEQVRNHLGNKLNVKSNWKLRAVRDMLLNHPSIKQVNDKPIVLLWSEDKPSLDRFSSNNIGTNTALVTQSDVSEVCDGKETKLSKVIYAQSDVSEVCDDGNRKQSRLSEVTGTLSDVCDVCDDAKESSPQVRGSEEVVYDKVRLSTDIQNEGDPDNDSNHSMDGTSHTSHTSLSRTVEEISSNGHDSNRVPDVALGEVSNTKTAESEKNEGCFRCFYCNEFCSNDKDRVAHIDYAHPGKLYYPTPEDFENRLRPN